MKTAEEVILLIKELPPDELRKVTDYLSFVREEESNSVRYSSDDMAKLDRDQEDCEKGVNVSGPFSEKNIIAYLESL